MTQLPGGQRETHDTLSQNLKGRKRKEMFLETGESACLVTVKNGDLSLSFRTHMVEEENWQVVL